MENQELAQVVEKKPGKNVLGIISVVFAGVSLIGSWIPLLNVISIIFGVVALIMGIISLIFVLTKKVTLLALPIIGIVLSIISIAISNGVNTAVSDSLSGKDTPDTKVSSSYSSSTASTTSNDSDENKEYKVGDTISVGGQEITVTNVQRNYKAKLGTANDGQEFIKVTVKLENKSDKNISANSLYFKIQDSNGTIENDHIDGYSMDDYFNASEIAPKGSKTGSILFEVPKGDNNLTFIYEPNVLSDKQVKIKL